MFLVFLVFYCCKVYNLVIFVTEVETVVMDRVTTKIFYAFVDPVTDLIQVGQTGHPMAVKRNKEYLLRRDLDMLFTAKGNPKRMPWRFIKRTQHPEDPYSRWYSLRHIADFLSKVEADRDNYLPNLP